MKKKLLLLLLTSFTVTAVATAVAISGSDQKYLSVKGGENSTFTIDYDSVVPIDDDYYEVLLRSEKGASIRIGLVGVTYEDGYFYAKGADEDFYFYNVGDESAVRGIGSSSITFANSNENGGEYSFEMNSMFSFNEIDLDEVLDGKYQDLTFFHDAYQGFEDKVYTTGVSDLPALASYRYFLSYVIPHSYGAKLYIKNITMDSVCEAEPSGSDELGTNDGELSSQIKESFGGSIEKVGNGSYYYEFKYDMYETLNQYCKKDAKSPLVSELEKNGFENTMTVEDTYIYQKFDDTQSDKVHTFSVATSSLNYSNVVGAMYFDNVSYIYPVSDSWPSDSISKVITKAHSDLVHPLSDVDDIGDYDIGYTILSQDYPGEGISIQVAAEFKDAVSEENLNSFAQSYLGLYLVDKFVLISETRVLSKDLRLIISVDTYASESMIGIDIIELEEDYLSSEAPTANQIAKAISRDGATIDADDITIVEGGNDARYEYYNSNYYEVYWCDEDYVDDVAIPALEANGYVPGSDGYYTKNVSITNSIYLELKFDEESESMRVRYELRNNPYSEIDSFETLLDRLFDYDVSSSTINNIIDNVTLDESFEYLYVNKSNQIGFVRNADEGLVNELKGLATSYIEFLDAYAFELNSHRLLRIYEAFDGVAIESVPVPSSDFGTYEKANTAITNFLAEHELNNSLAVLFNEGDNLGAKFFSEYSTVGYCGSLEQINSVKTLFANRVEDNFNFRYSSYLDCYVNETSNFSYSFNVGQYSNEFYVLRISLELFTEFVDFDSYDNLELENVSLLVEFPDLVTGLEEKAKNYFVLTKNETEIAELAVNDVFDLNTYKEALNGAGFTGNSNGTVFSKNGEEGIVYNVNLIEYENNTHIRFTKSGPWYSGSELRTALENTDTEYLIDDFIGWDYMSSSNPAYYYDAENDLIKFNNSYNYYSQFVSHLKGYEFSRSYTPLCDKEVYVREEEGYKIIVETNEGDLYSTIKVSWCYTIEQYFSWDDVLSYFTENELDYSSYLSIFPSTTDGYYYDLWADTENNAIEFYLNENYLYEGKLDNYITALTELENYDSENSGITSDGCYVIHFTDSDIEIYIAPTQYYYYSLVYIYLGSNE